MDFMILQESCSVQGAPIIAYTNNRDASEYTYLIAGVHGDEPEGVFILNKFFAWLKQQNILNPIIVIPIVNPDGLEAGTRVNANTVDLNRNWPSHNWTSSFKNARYNPGAKPLSEPENIFLADLFRKYKPSLIFSFHSWQALLDHNNKAKLVADYISKFNDYKAVDYIGYPTPGSLGSYADETLNCAILTYELPPAKGDTALETLWVANAEGLQNYFMHIGND